MVTTQLLHSFNIWRQLMVLLLLMTLLKTSLPCTIHGHQNNHSRTCPKNLHLLHFVENHDPISEAASAICSTLKNLENSDVFIDAIKDW
jgi:hypothetical protein